MEYLKSKIEGGDKNDIILDFTINVGDFNGDYCGSDKCNRSNRSRTIR